MNDEKRPRDGVRAEPMTPPPEAEPHPDAPDPDLDFFDKQEHDGWGPIRRRGHEPRSGLDAG